MDKILTKKILGLKVEDILKCVLLVGVGYCIAVMLGNCNCVEGLPFVCENTGPANCTVEDCNADGDGYCSPETCPGWQIDTTGYQGPDPVIYTPSLLYTCENSEGSDVGYDSIDECNKNKPTVQVFSSQRPPCPNPTYPPPTPPPPPPPPPPTPTPQTIVCENGSCNQYPTSEAAGKTGNKINCLEVFGKIDCDYAKADCEKNCNTPPPTPSVCAYYGDGLTRRKRDSKALDSEFWRSRSEHKQGEEVNECRDSIGICRDAWKKWAADNNKPYTGFCIQTLKDGKYEGAADVRGDCPLTPAPGGSIPDTWITYNNGKTPEQNCTSKDTVGPEGGKGNAGDFAWVSEKLDKTCKCEEDSGNTNTFTRSTTFSPGDAMAYVEDIEKKLGFGPMA